MYLFSPDAHSFTSFETDLSNRPQGRFVAPAGGCPSLEGYSILRGSLCFWSSELWSNLESLNIKVKGKIFSTIIPWSGNW